MKHRILVPAAAIIGVALGLGGVASAASKSKRPVQAVRTIAVAPNFAIDKWWMEHMPEEGGFTHSFKTIGAPEVAVARVPMSAIQKDCIGAAFRPKVSEWKRKQLAVNPEVGFSESEESAFVDVLDQCGMTIPTMLFAEADLYRMYLPKTKACLIDAWTKQPALAKNYLATRIFYNATPPDEANLRALMQRCITPADIAALQKKIEDTFASVNKAMG
jgi:hypothetical protein